jgi:hypothetical protein
VRYDAGVTLRLVIVVCLAVPLAAGCGDSRLGPAALATKADSIGSQAAEGALLARDAAAGRSTSTFVRIHAADLRKVASQQANALRGRRTSADLDSARRRLAGLAARVAADLDRLDQAKPREQRALAHDLDAVARRAGQIGASLA